MKNNSTVVKNIFLFVCILWASLLNAQQFPVAVTPILTPPYSLRLGDYATTTENKLQLQLLMRDLMEPSHQIKLRFTLESGLNATPIATSAPFVEGFQDITLYPGTPLMLTNIELRPLFRLENLTGINAVTYSQPLPQGVYQFCFQVFDAITGRALSAKSGATAYLVQYEPPLLNLPQQGEKIQKQSEFQHVVFQWMPRQVAANTRYIFTLKELWDAQRDPISGFQTSRPLWQEETYAPTLFYGMDKTALIPGKRYAWQVQAKSGNPVYGNSPTEDNGVYQNNGLSEIFYFDYVEDCLIPTFLIAKNAGRGRVEIRWNLTGNNPAGMYRIQYRKKGSTATWAQQESYQQTVILSGLNDNVEYEYRIGSVCGNLYMGGTTNPMTGDAPTGNAYAYSGIQYFTTDSKNSSNDSFQCGIMPAVDIANKAPLTTALGINEVFMAGDFPVTVLQSQGAAGTYSGTGYIQVPYLADTKLKVSFNNIKLNTDKQLIEGLLETTYDPNESALMYTSQGIGETFGDAGVTTVSVDYTISDIQYMATPPPGKIIITGNSGSGNANDSGSGQSSTQELPAGKDYTITDKDGNVWNVDEKGEVTKGGKVAPGGASTAKNTDGITGSGSNAQVTKYTAKGVKIQWQETDNTKYAFDTADKEPLLKDKYPTLTDADGNTVYVSYKAVVNKQTDELLARIIFTDESLKDNLIIFKTLNTGSEIEASKSSDTDYRLSLNGSMDYAEEDIIAVLMPKDTTQKQQVISSFKLVHLEAKTINVALVATDDVSKGKLDNIIEQTNAIWSKAGVTINFIKDEQVFDITPYLEGSSTILTEKNTLLSTYSSVQQAINKAYGNSDRYVLFVSDKPSSTGQMGYMRLNGQFGYIFKSSNEKTAAHELGHGVFNLEHPWEQYKTTEGTTDLLMDYANGSTLTHLDWKQINDPKLKLYAFQSQKAGEFNNPVLTPNFDIVNINSMTLAYTDPLVKGIPEGTCPGFVTYDYDSNSKEFKNIKRYYWDNLVEAYVSDTDVIEPYPITPYAKLKITLFYNYKDCPGGLLNITYSDLSTVFQKASKEDKAKELLSVIKNNRSKSIPLKCVDFKSTENSNEWTNGGSGIGVPLNCMADNIKDLLKTELENINSITADYSAKETAEILQENYKECVFANISIEQRIIILNNLIDKVEDDAEWEFSKTVVSLGDYFFLDELILSTAEADRIKLLKDGFMKNDYQWIKVLFDQGKGSFNNDVTMSEILPLFRGLASWVSKYHDQLEIPITKSKIYDIGPKGFNEYEYPTSSVTPVLLGTYDDEIVYDLGDGYDTKIIGKSSVSIDSGYINFYQRYSKTISSEQWLEPEGTNSRPNHITPMSLYVTPFEPVIMLANRSYPFLDTEKELEIPAFLAAAYQQMILDEKGTQNIRSLGNAVAVTAAVLTIPATGGASLGVYLTVVGGVVATMDETISSIRNDLSYQDAQQYEEYYNAWNTFYTAYAIVEGGYGLYKIAPSAYKFVNNARKVNFVAATKNYYSKMKGFNYKGHLSDFWTALKGESGAIKVVVKADLLSKFNDFANIKSWINSLDDVADANLLSKIDDLETGYFSKLDADLVHHTYGNEIKTLLKESPDDLINIWKRLKDDPAYSWELSKEGGSRWQIWGQREFFKDVIGKGKAFEETVCLNAFKNKTSKEYLELKQKFMNDFGKNLDDYDMYSQVQLTYNNAGDYFIADQVFVKYKTIGGQKIVDDIVVIENKLSSTTPLTSPQSGALKSGSYKVRSVQSESQFTPNTFLKQETTLNFSDKIQWYKVHDGANGDVISGINQIQ